MAALFDLPSEVLFDILDLVITSIHWPDGSVRYRLIGGTLPDFPFPLYRYCVPKLNLAGRHPALDLLLTSRRLYSETKAYLSKKSQILDLDVAIVNDHWIWPTWRSLPVRKAGTFKRIDVHFIHCCTEDERQLQTDWDQYSTTHIRHLDWKLLNPLHNLVGNANVNPHVKNTLSDFLYQPFSGRITGHPTISRTEILAFHFDTRGYGNGHRLLSESEVPIRKIDGLAHLDFKKLYPGNVQKANSFQDIVHDNLTSWFQEGKEKENLSPRIGKILFILDGKIVRYLDPAEYVVRNAGRSE